MGKENRVVGISPFLCPRCHAITLEKHARCPECGEPLEMQCPNCKFTWRFFVHYTFCPSCGQRVPKKTGGSTAKG